MRPDFDEIRTLTKRFVLIPQKVAKFVFGVFRYADLSVLGDYKLRKAITFRNMCLIHGASEKSDDDYVANTGQSSFVEHIILWEMRGSKQL